MNPQALSVKLAESTLIHSENALQNGLFFNLENKNRFFCISI
jgi:hypothetical protein